MRLPLVVFQVSAAKYARAERELKATKPLGDGSKKFYESAEVGAEKAEGDKGLQKLYVAITSDRGMNAFLLNEQLQRAGISNRSCFIGLCGAVHTSVARTIRNELQEHGDNVKVVCVGDKARGILQRLYGQNILFVVNEVTIAKFVTKESSAQ